MSKRTKIAAILLGILSLALAGAGVTISYLSGEDRVTNIFTVGDLDLGLRETDWDPEDGDGENTYPGYSVYKNPTVKNITSNANGEQPCYVRMRILLADSDGKAITDSDRIALIRTLIRYDHTYTGDYEKKGRGETIVQGRIPGYSLEEIEALPMINPVFSVDEKRSTEQEIVCNYMGEDRTGILQIGEEAVLFTALVIPTQWNKKEIDLLGDFQIIVKAEAIQVAGFASKADAYTALDTQMKETGTV